MSLERVRFLHSSDWQIEQPLGGVPEVPAELHDEFLRAPYRAAERVVELAIRERVDFLVLTGNLLCLESASPHALEFLMQQFERLAEQQITVYWLGGREDDPDLWPANWNCRPTCGRFPWGELSKSRMSARARRSRCWWGRASDATRAFAPQTMWAVASRHASPWSMARCKPRRWRPRASAIGHSVDAPAISDCWRAAPPPAMPAAPKVGRHTRLSDMGPCWWS